VPNTIFLQHLNERQLLPAKTRSEAAAKPIKLTIDRYITTRATAKLLKTAVLLALEHNIT
jgi:hypothetical protein